MKPRSLAVISLVILLGIGAWMTTRKVPVPNSGPKRQAASPPALVPPPVAAENTPPGTTQEAAPLPPQPQREAARNIAKLAMANPLIPSDVVPRPAARRVTDVIPEAAPEFDKIALMFRDYRAVTGENPVGTNAEIMKALTGDNPKGAKLGPPEGQQLNSNGELIDRWGTPYFFHQLTSDRMEIRSAGPDRILWNEDDLTGD